MRLPSALNLTLSFSSAMAPCSAGVPQVILSQYVKVAMRLSTAERDLADGSTPINSQLAWRCLALAYMPIEARSLASIRIASQMRSCACAAITRIKMRSGSQSEQTN
jgi:hypothetical protein